MKDPALRSFERIDSTDLQRLSNLAKVDREVFFDNHPDWALYRNRVLCVALCQGAALHYLRGNVGINDFDVYTFYVAHPARTWYSRQIRSADFGSAKFGKSEVTKEWFVGRRVDFLSRALPAGLQDDPVHALRRYLAAGKTDTALELAAKAVVLLDPQPLRGTVVWPVGEQPSNLRLHPSAPRPILRRRGEPRSVRRQRNLSRFVTRWKMFLKRCIALVVLTLAPASVWAQDTLHNWSALNSSGLSTVYVLDDTGQETTGKFLRLDADSLFVLVDGRERRFEAARVRRLAKRGDSLKNGLHIGAIIGAVLGWFGVDDSSGGRRAASVAGIAGVYAGVGLGIDALRQGRTTLYEAPGSGSGLLPQQRLAQRRYTRGASANVAITW